MIRYSRACGSHQNFLDRGLMLTRKLMNQGFLLFKLKSSLRRFYGPHQDLVDRYEIYPAMTAYTDQYSLPNIFFLYWSVINRIYKCKSGHFGGYCFQIHTQNYFKYMYNRPVNIYLRFKISG